MAIWKHISTSCLPSLVYLLKDPRVAIELHACIRICFFLVRSPWFHQFFTPCGANKVSIRRTFWRMFSRCLMTLRAMGCRSNVTKGIEKHGHLMKLLPCMNCWVTPVDTGGKHWNARLRAELLCLQLVSHVLLFAVCSLSTSSLVISFKQFILWKFRLQLHSWSCYAHVSVVHGHLAGDPKRLFQLAKHPPLQKQPSRSMRLMMMMLRLSRPQKEACVCAPCV